MEHLEESILEKTQIYPPIYWGKRKDEYGLENKLLILIERDPKIWHNLYPQDCTDYYQKTAQCKKLARTLFTNIPEISVHFKNHDGLENYGYSVYKKLQSWEVSFIKVLSKMPPSSNWPDQRKIKLLGPSFVRLAPLLWGHMKTRKKFSDPVLSMAHARLQFCTAITVYDPQRANAQIAFQDAVLRHPPRSYDSPTPNSASGKSLPKPDMMTYYSPQQGSALVIDPYASQPSEHRPQISQQNSVSDTAVLSNQHTPRHDGRQARSGAFQPPQREKAAQKITTEHLGENRDRPGKLQLQQIEPLLDERDPQANCVHHLELEIMELKGKVIELERIVIELMGKKRRRCSSQPDQEDAVDEAHLAKKQRRYEGYEEPNPQAPEKARHSSSERDFREAFRYLNSGREEDIKDNPITSTDTMPLEINHMPIASADFSQAENREESHPWHSPPHLKPRAWQEISYASSTALFVPQLRKAALLEAQQRFQRAPYASPHQYEHEPAKDFPTATQTQVHTKKEALSSTQSPCSKEEDETELSTWEDLGKVRLRTWKKEVGTTPHIKSDLEIAVKDKNERNNTTGFVKPVPLEE